MLRRLVVPLVALVLSACTDGTDGTSEGATEASTSSGSTDASGSSAGSTSVTSTSTSTSVGETTSTTTTSATTDATDTHASTSDATSDATSDTTSDTTTGPGSCDAIVGSTDCPALVAVSGDLTLEACMLCQGARCGSEPECDSQYPCVDGSIVLQGCCTDAQCEGLTPFCGMFLGTNNVCVLSDDV